MNIEWKEGAVCYADNHQWFFNDSVKPYKLVSNMQGTSLKSYSDVLSMTDFQLNTIEQGDCIEDSELNTEQKYNDVVEVFELFGLKPSAAVLNFNSSKSKSLTCVGVELWRGLVTGIENRKLTYQQIMTIGELKRLDLKTERVESKEWFPVVGSKVTWVEREIVGTVKCIDNGLAWILCPTGQHTQQKVSSLKPPKTPEEFLHDELVVMRNRTEEYFIDELLKNFRLIRKEDS